MDNLTPEKLQQVFAHIDRLLCSGKQITMAIDGPCTAGKTTLSGLLSQRYGCLVLHMDSFFLQPAQRTPARFAEPGGNVDYVRFLEEVLLPLQKGLPFSYRPYDCSRQILSAPVCVTPGALTVVEGTYSQHPHFADPYDLKIFIDIDPALQHSRILERPAALQSRFFREWIPMEQLYFQHFSIRERCDLIL